MLVAAYPSPSLSTPHRLLLYSKNSTAAHMYAPRSPTPNPTRPMMFYPTEAAAHRWPPPALPTQSTPSPTSIHNLSPGLIYYPPEAAAHRLVASIGSLAGPCLTLLPLSQAHPTLTSPHNTTGLIYYLPEAAAHRLVASIGSLAAPGSPLYFDYMQLAALTGQAHKYPGFMVTAKVRLRILFFLSFTSTWCVTLQACLKLNNRQHCVTGLVCFVSQCCSRPPLPSLSLS